MPYWFLIPAAISAVGAISSAVSGRAQSENQQAWSEYNATMQNQIDRSNIESQTMLGMFNAVSSMQAAQKSSESIASTASYNASLIAATTEYNNSLLSQDLEEMWEASGLDLAHLEQQRAQERGGLRAQIAASGTVIDEGVNKDLVVNQMAQEKMDAFVIGRNADLKAASIQDQIAENVWKGQMEVEKTIWEGQMASYNLRTDTQTQVMSGLANTLISRGANQQSADLSYKAGMAGAQLTGSQNSIKIQNNLTSGLVSSVGQGVSAYYNQAPTSSLLTEG